jgi:retinol-binding protein 3
VRILACCLLLVTVSVSAQPATRPLPPTLPDTPVGHVLSDWLDSFNSGDESRMRSFLEKYRWSSPLIVQMNRRHQTGGYDLTAVRQSEPLRIEFFATERASGTRTLARLNVTDSDPPQVVTLLFASLPEGDAPVLGFGIDAQTRGKVIDQAIAQLQELYVVPETAGKMVDALRQHQKDHDYDAVTEGDLFAFFLTVHLRLASGDKHVGVRFSPARAPDNPLAPDPRQQQRNNCAFRKVEVLPGNVGYVKFDGFEPPADCGTTAVAAMRLVGNTDALIFDLRDNIGGNPGMVALICSYLFGEPTHLNDVWDRTNDTTLQSWTSAYVAGKRLPAVPVYVLTSGRTFSAAEELAYDLQSLKRATVVGEATGGGAHGVRPARLDDRFMMIVPFTRSINPVTGTDWEGHGVQPDVEVPAADALATAQKLASEKLGAANE